MAATPIQVPRRPAIVWSVVDEHLSEASFLWVQWERLLDATDHSFAEIVEDDEPRLLAHLEGLAIGGQPVAHKRLLPLLEGGEEFRTVCAAAHALLEAPDRDWIGVILERLQEDDEALRQGLLRALELSGCPDISTALLQQLPEASPALQTGILAVLRHRHTHPGDALSRMDGATSNVSAAAVRAATFAPLSLVSEFVRRGLTSDDASVRLAALETGLRRGLPIAWQACRAAREANGPEVRLGLLALSVGGTARDLKHVVAALDKPALQTEALWALGFSGKLAAADALFSILQAEASSLAAESFSAITGLPLHPPFVNDTGEDTETGSTDASIEAKVGDPTAAIECILAPPSIGAGHVDSGKVEQWWSHARGRFDAESRYLYGHPCSVQSLLSALESAPMRRRAAMAFEIAIRSQGHCLIEPRLWAATQHRQAQELRKVRPRNLVVAFEALQAS
ncbi:TIGR02270 family protein [Myxococcus xanthus]|uniref:TIGR02270 family protein n=1 Tax=Myxococcus xanthus TaxID=34 RepID=UPI001162DA47|nr:TIGR02270 family protein [Myxococcus xanthus]QDF01404.1 hypothetical protein BHS05_25225 [Myxococcus xanthus]